jgi:hypothetical protein
MLEQINSPTAQNAVGHRVRSADFPPAISGSWADRCQFLVTLHSRTWKNRRSLEAGSGRSILATVYLRGPSSGRSVGWISNDRTTTYSGHLAEVTSALHEYRFTHLKC